jgi:hypothetical protein
MGARALSRLILDPKQLSSALTPHVQERLIEQTLAAAATDETLAERDRCMAEATALRTTLAAAEQQQAEAKAAAAAALAEAEVCRSLRVACYAPPAVCHLLCCCVSLATCRLVFVVCCVAVCRLLRDTCFPRP